jgi:hypothetical protein
MEFPASGPFTGVVKLLQVMSKETTGDKPDTEDQICDLINMASLAASGLQQEFESHRRAFHDYDVAPRNLPELVLISDEAQERLMFAIYDVLNRAKALREHLGFAPAGVG